MQFAVCTNPIHSLKLTHHVIFIINNVKLWNSRKGCTKYFYVPYLWIIHNILDTDQNQVFINFSYKNVYKI